MEHEDQEFRMRAEFSEPDGSFAFYNCDLVFEEGIPKAVWQDCPEKQIWVPLDKSKLQRIDTFIGTEFVHYFYQIPIRLYEKRS